MANARTFGSRAAGDDDVAGRRLSHGRTFAGTDAPTYLLDDLADQVHAELPTAVAKQRAQIVLQGAQKAVDLVKAAIAKVEKDATTDAVIDYATLGGGVVINALARIQGKDNLDSALAQLKLLLDAANTNLAKIQKWIDSDAAVREPITDEGLRLEQNRATQLAQQAQTVSKASYSLNEAFFIGLYQRALDMGKALNAAPAAIAEAVKGAAKEAGHQAAQGLHELIPYAVAGTVALGLGVFAINRVLR